MKKFLAFCLSLVMILTLTACAKEAEETAEVEYADGDTFIISVCGLDLKYPAKWLDKVTVTTSDDRACFACGDTKLFDLTFNVDEGNILGTVEGEETIVIRVVDYTFDTEDNELYEMQEDVNVILQHLMEDYTFTAGEAVETTDDTTFDIKTELVTLKYPAVWKDKVQVEVTEDTVKFSNNGTPIFDLVFYECDGYLLGTYNGTPIYIVDYDVENDEQAAMQENVNVIIHYLMEDENFVIGD